jgi:hypothetical protein
VGIRPQHFRPVSLVGVADFDGDGHKDYALVNLSTRPNRDPVSFGTQRFVVAFFGPTIPGAWQLTDVADFNGDGKPDYVLYNAITRQTAIWYLNNSVLVSGASGPTLPPG